MLSNGKHHMKCTKRDLMALKISCMPMNVFDLIFGRRPALPLIAQLKVDETDPGYFCLSSGVVLIGIAIFTFVSYGEDPRHTGRFTRFLSISSCGLVGLGLTLLSTAVLTGAASIIGSTSWTLPLLVFLLLICTWKHNGSLTFKFSLTASSAFHQSYSWRMASWREALT